MGSQGPTTVSKPLAGRRPLPRLGGPGGPWLSYPEQGQVRAPAPRPPCQPPTRLLGRGRWMGQPQTSSADDVAFTTSPAEIQRVWPVVVGSALRGNVSVRPEVMFQKRCESTKQPGLWRGWGNGLDEFLPLKPGLSLRACQSSYFCSGQKSRLRSLDRLSYSLLFLYKVSRKKSVRKMQSSNHSTSHLG